MSSLSVVVIAKNNEGTIDDALRSAKGLSDDVVVVDTGCTDKTMRIARGYGAHVVKCPLPFDYAKARNLGSVAAEGEWVFHLDTDERFDERQVERVHHAIDQQEFTQYFIAQINYDKGIAHLQERLQPRLFKRSAHQHVGLTYESLVPISVPGHLDVFLEHYMDESLNFKKAAERGAFVERELRSLQMCEPQTVMEATQVIARCSNLRGSSFDAPQIYLLVANMDERGTSFEPNNELLAWVTGCFYGRAKWYDEALETITRIPLDTDHSHVFWESLACIRAFTGNVQGGLEALRVAAKQHPCAKYFKGQALYLTELGDTKSAIPMMEQAVEMMPLHPHYKDILTLLKAKKS